MSCYHPLRAIPVGINSDTGKIKYAIRKDDGLLGHREEGEILVPCGQCIGCRLDRSRDWANRCMLELRDHKESVFVTLTYDNDHVPIVTSPSGNSVMTLDKRDFQLFIKRLRKSLGEQKIRYYACSEYGPQTYRPHYHAIIFGYCPVDLRPFSKSPQGYQYYVSDTLTNIWSKGHVLIGEVSWETCAYTARYIASKYLGEMSSFYTEQGIEPPMSFMSRRPGIGGNLYARDPDFFEVGSYYLSTDYGSKEIRIPKYFLNKLSVDFPEKYDKIKADRKQKAELLQREKNLASGLLPDQQRELDEAAQLARASSLERRFI